jgi:hypothetical protein
MQTQLGSQCLSSIMSGTLNRDRSAATRSENVERYRAILAHIATGETLPEMPPSDLPRSLHTVIDAWVRATEQSIG